MVFLCNICKEKMELHENILVCKNGHVITNTLEEKDEGEFELYGKGKRIRQKKKKSNIIVFKETSLDKLRIFYMIFRNAKDYFKFTEETIFKLYCGLYSFKKLFKQSEENIFSKFDDIFLRDKFTFYKNYSLFIKEFLRLNQKITNVSEEKYDAEKTDEHVLLEKDILPHVCEIICCIYLSKRLFMEKQDKIYTLNDFTKELDAYDFNKQSTQFFWQRFHFYDNMFFDWHKNTVVLDRILRILTEKGFYNTRCFYKGKYINETGVISDYVESVKHNFRVQFMRSMELNIKYLYKVHDLLNLSGISNFLVLKYIQMYKKYFYIQENERVYVPELECAYFTYFYIENYHFTMLKEIFKKICNVFGISRSFLTENLERKAKIMQNTGSFSDFVDYMNKKQAKDMKIYKNLESAQKIIEKNIRKYYKIKKEEDKNV